MFSKAVLLLLVLLFTFTILSAFNDITKTHGTIKVYWTTNSEEGLLGFFILRSDVNDMSTAFILNPFIYPAYHADNQFYSGVDGDVIIGQTYYYWIQFVNYNGTSTYSDYLMLTALPPIPTPPPEITSLGYVYPNPVHQYYDSYIMLDVKSGDRATLKIFNVRGQALKTTLYAEGRYYINWDQKDEDGRQCSSGTYFYQMTTQTHKLIRKFVIIK